MTDTLKKRREPEIQPFVRVKPAQRLLLHQVEAVLRQGNIEVNIVDIKTRSKEDLCQKLKTEILDFSVELPLESDLCDPRL